MRRALTLTLLALGVIDCRRRLRGGSVCCRSVDANVVFVWSLRAHVARRRHSGELSKLVCQVRLVAVTARQGKVCPVDRCTHSDGTQHSTEAREAAIQFRGHPNLFAEQVTESTAAQAGVGAQS